MANACVDNQYFSGQGAILVGGRDVSGNPTGLRPVGNVSALTLGVETTTFEHKESCSGVRGVDLEIVQEINVSMAMTMESINKENLSLGLYGTSNVVSGATVTDEPAIAYHDLWTPLVNIQVNTVVVTDVGGATTYTEGTDYVVNESAGTIKALSTGAITDAQPLEVDYNFVDQDNIDALISGTPPIKFVRFEGLNTADNNKPVVIDIFKVSLQPLAEWALIQDEIAQMEVESKILSDPLRVSGSNYFKVRRVA
ncbi:MAG: hypothetical protein KAH32_02670 [Chlamydiia bacterium]|nr:hypothetical protein [Chlamydiia bacterium]